MIDRTKRLIGRVLEVNANLRVETIIAAPEAIENHFQLFGELGALGVGGWISARGIADNPLPGARRDNGQARDLVALAKLLELIDDGFNRWLPRPGLGRTGTATKAL